MCAQYGRPAGVAFCLQVCRYSIEPAVANRACNLFPKDMLRAALADEVKEDGPEVAFVLLRESFACIAEWLAGARACPNRSICWPSGKLQGKAPSADSGKEMTLDESA